MPAKKKPAPEKLTAAQKRGMKIIANNIAKASKVAASKRKKLPPSPGWYIPNSNPAFAAHGLEGLKAYGNNNGVRRINREQPVIVILESGLMIRLQVVDDELCIIKGRDEKENNSIIVRGDTYKSLYVK